MHHRYKAFASTPFIGLARPRVDTKLSTSNARLRPFRDTCGRRCSVRRRGCLLSARTCLHFFRPAGTRERWLRNAVSKRPIETSPSSRGSDGWGASLNIHRTARPGRLIASLSMSIPLSLYTVRCLSMAFTKGSTSPLLYQIRKSSTVFMSWRATRLAVSVVVLRDAPSF